MSIDFSKFKAGSKATRAPAPQASTGPDILPTNLYDAEIKLCHFMVARSGALGVRLTADVADEEGLIQSEFRTTLWVTSGDAKGNKTTYKDRSGEDRQLPGFVVMNDICVHATGKELFELQDTMEQKMVQLWDPAKQKMAPKEVDTLTILHGKKVKLGIREIIENKRAQNASSGKWEPTNEENRVNDVDVVYGMDGTHALELQIPEAERPTGENRNIESWKSRNQDKPVNRFKKVKEAPKKTPDPDDDLPFGFDDDKPSGPAVKQEKENELFTD